MKKLIFLAVLVAVFIPFISKVEAATPRLTVSPQYNGNNNVQVSIWGADAYSNVQLFYTPSNSNSVQSIGSIGTTDGNGNFNVSLNPNAYGMTGGSASFIYVIVNGQRSESIAWPGYYNGNNYNNYNNGSLTLSQSNLTLSTGQTQSVTLSNYNYNNGYSYNSYYISGNTNSNIANVTLSGNLVMVTANNVGTTNVTICSQNGGCTTLYINVQNNYNNNNNNCWYNNCYNQYPYNNQYNNQYVMPVTVNRNSVTVAVGQSAQVTLSGSTQGYYVTSDGYTVRTSGVGNKLTIFGQTPGTSQVTVCSTNNQYNNQNQYGNQYGYGYQNNQNGCAVVWVNVTGNYGWPQYQYQQYPYQY